MTDRGTRVIAEMVKLGIDRRLLREYHCGTAEPPQTDAYHTASQRKNRRVKTLHPLPQMSPAAGK